MQFSAEGLLLFLLFVLPGAVLQLRTARYAPVVQEQRSVVRELTDALLWSLFLSPIALSVTYLGLRLINSGADLYLLLDAGLGEYAMRHPVRAGVLVIIYAWLANGLAILVGAYNGPLRIKRAALRIVDLALARLTLLRWIRGQEDIYEETVWWLALQHLPEEMQRPDVLVNARLKTGARYIGKLRLLPIDRQDVQAKDFAIHRARRINVSNEVLELPPDDVVLLNFAECESLECHYYNEQLQPLVTQPTSLATSAPVPSPTTTVT